jgi:hypothetical protein
MIQVLYGVTGVIVLVSLALIVWMTALAMSYNAKIQNMAIADMSYNSGNYKLALDVYSGMTREWFEPTSPMLKYRLAQTHAQMNDQTKAVAALNSLVGNTEHDFVSVALLDPAFDKIRQTFEFKEFEKRIAKTNP